MIPFSFLLFAFLKGIQVATSSPVPYSAVAWGDRSGGGDASNVDLTDVVDISCGWSACVSRKNDGTAVAWGGSAYGGDASNVDLIDVADISCGTFACVARKNDGTAVAWGRIEYGGDASSVDLRDVADISCGGLACVARKNDGTAVAWGDSKYGGDASNVELTDVADISCGTFACVTRKNDGTTLTPSSTPLLITPLLIGGCSLFVLVSYYFLYYKPSDSSRMLNSKTEVNQVGLERAELVVAILL